MSALDIIIGLVLAGTIIAGLRRGFFHELLGLVGIAGGTLAGIWGAATLGESFANWLPDFAGKSVTAYLLCFTLLFLAFYFLTRNIAKHMKESLDNSSLGWINNTLGGLLGGVKGAIVLSLIFMYAEFLPIKGFVDSSRKESVLYEPVERVFPLLYEALGSPDELPEPIRKLIKQGKERVINDATDEFEDNLRDALDER